MKFRVPVAILLTASLFLAACGGESDQEKAQKAFADAIEQATKEIDKSGLNTDKSDTKDKADDSKDSSGTSDKAGSKDKTDSSDSKSTDKGSSGTMNAGQCLEVSMTYAALGLASLGSMLGGTEMSDSDLKELQSSISELTAKLPKEIQSDFAVVAEAYNTAAKEGFASKKAQEALSSSKFEKADTNVTDYIESLCG